ncbi:MAG: NAD kinase [Alphaproteobacteria bacterium]|jgi:NAD+ kinase|nr:NAD kinase [Alphaproteobacteria bacterium]
MKIACVYSKYIAKAKDFYDILAKKYPLVSISDADVIICLGGDGFMLSCLHEFFNIGKPLYGINCGTIGFLLNERQDSIDIIGAVSHAVKFNIHPLVANFTTATEENIKTIAFNEISLLRKKPRSAHLSIDIDNENRIEQLIGDGILIATPVGSTAYNYSCGGNVLSTNSNLLALTPINPFNPLRWKGTTLKDDSIIDIKNTEENRPINMSADFQEFEEIKHISIKLCKEKHITLLFDRHRDLESKIIKQQFHQQQ